MDAKPLRTDIESLRQTVDDLSPRNRMLNLPDRARSGCVHFDCDPRLLRDRLAGGAWLDIRDPMLRRDDEASQSDDLLARLATTALNLRDSLGIDGVMLVLGLATWHDGSIPRTAPLLLAPVEFSEGTAGLRIRSLADPGLNPTLLRRIGLHAEAFPTDPLDYRAREGGPNRITDLAPVALLGAFTPLRLSLGDRLDPRRSARLLRNPNCLRLTGQSPASTSQETTPWERRTDAPPGLDAAQARIVARVQNGQNLLVDGPPGTGKTQVLAALAAAAVANAKTVLVVSDTVAALDALQARIRECVPDQRVLALYGAAGHGRAVAEALGRTPGPVPVDLLRDLSRAARPGIVLASTLSYLAHVPEEWNFDLVLVDEASQVPLVHALPPLAAAKQAVICGDTRQMRPVAHLTRLLDSVLTNDAPVSLLDAAEATSWQKEPLTHHYRSRHPALFEGVNRIFYQDRLRIAPAPRRPGSRGLSSVRVPGRFDRRVTQTNPVEAKALVDHLVRIRQAGSEQSVLVIAMTEGQRDLIARKLRDAGIDQGAERAPERLIVTTTDGIQGIERDLVLISLTYGPDQPGGKPPTSYGPVGSADGEARVNVMMTRSRDATVIFASVDAIEIMRNRSAGQNALITLLKIAERRAVLAGQKYAGPLLEVLEKNHCTAQAYGRSLALEDLARRSIGVLYITGTADPRDEAAEMFQLERNGWKVAPVGAAEAEGCIGETAAAKRVGDVIRSFRTSL